MYVLKWTDQNDNFHFLSGNNMELWGERGSLAISEGTASYRKHDPVTRRVKIGRRSLANFAFASLYKASQTLRFSCRLAWLAYFLRRQSGDKGTLWILILLLTTPGQGHLFWRRNARCEFHIISVNHNFHISCNHDGFFEIRLYWLKCYGDMGIIPRQHQAKKRTKYSPMYGVPQ